MSNSISATIPPAVQAAADPVASVRAASAQATDKPQLTAPSKERNRPDLEAIRRELKQAVARLNEQAQKDKRNISFSMDEVSDRVVITVRKSETGEVIRQIPDESLLRVAHNIEELKGLLHNETT